MQATLTPMLPPSPLKDSEHSPFSHDVQIQGIADHVDVMSSLQKPKKVTGTSAVDRQAACPKHGHGNTSSMVAALAGTA